MTPFLQVHFMCCLMEKLKHKIKKHYHYHKHYLPHYLVIGFYTTVTIFGLYSLFPPKVAANTLSPQPLDQEIEVSLWGWVNESSLLVKSNYDTPLSAQLHTMKFNPLKKRLVIKPLDLLYPDTEYRFEIEAKNWLGLKTTKTVSFNTTPLPKITSQNKFTSETPVAADTKFKFKLDSNLDTAYFSFNPVPSFEYSKQVSDNNLLITPKKKLKQGQSYTISLSIKSSTFGNPILYTDRFSVIDPLEIVSSTPTNGATLIAKQTGLEFVFNKDVSQEKTDKLIKIEPQIEYSLAWKDSKTLNLIPSNYLSTNTTYKVTFNDTLSGTDGSQFDEDKVISFSTAGKVVVTAFSPIGNSVSFNSTVAVTFNQPVDKASAQGSFSISPNIGGAFAWSGNTLFYKTNGLAMLSNYTINIRAGIKSLGGEDSVQNFSSSFTTTSERSRTIGYSVKGRSIVATYFGTGLKKILLIGTMHGSEGNTGNMLNSWINYLRNNQKQIGSDRTFIIVPYSNPDGRAANNRFNTNNVDLNRNWDLPDWQALTYWQYNSYPSGGGSSPFSEPETRALRDFVYSENPVVSITYHANANMVLGDGIAQIFGDWYSNMTGYNRSQSSSEESDISALGYVITGTYEEWASKRGVVTLVVEFISQTANEYTRNFPALKGLLTYPI